MYHLGDARYRSGCAALLARRPSITRILWQRSACAFVVPCSLSAPIRAASGLGWFLVAFFLSPIVGVLLLLIFPNLKHARLLQTAISAQTRRLEPPPLPKAGFLGRADRVTIDRTPRPFEPDGVYAGIPYKVAEDGSIDAVMQGAMVRFSDFEKFTRALGGLSV
jgi:hypothetical protein